MAIRKKLNHDDKTREKIQKSQIVNSLINHALGKTEMSATQVRAAEILLKKILPDLQSIALTDSDGGPVRIVASIVDERI